MQSFQILLGSKFVWNISYLVQRLRFWHEHTWPDYNLFDEEILHPLGHHDKEICFMNWQRGRCFAYTTAGRIRKRYLLIISLSPLGLRKRNYFRYSLEYVCNLSACREVASQKLALVASGTKSVHIISDTPWSM
jgi:hypothetical protein